MRKRRGAGVSLGRALLVGAPRLACRSSSCTQHPFAVSRLRLRPSQFTQPPGARARRYMMARLRGTPCSVTTKRLEARDGLSSAARRASRVNGVSGTGGGIVFKIPSAPWALTSRPIGLLRPGSAHRGEGLPLTRQAGRQPEGMVTCRLRTCSLRRRRRPVMAPRERNRKCSWKCRSPSALWRGFRFVLVPRALDAPPGRE